MRKEKTKFRLGIKMVIFVTLILIFAMGNFSAFNYFSNKSRIENYYKSTTSNIARTVAEMIDGDQVEKIYTRLISPEYTALREEAEKNKDEKIIKDWLRENGIWDDYMSIRKSLEQIKKNMDVQYLYIEQDEQKDTMILIDPNEPLYYVGRIEESEQEFEDLVGNIHIDPVISNGKYGWICSAYDPVYNSEGKAVASVGVDIDMNAISAEWMMFLRLQLIYAFGSLVVFSIIGILLVQRNVTGPLKKLTSEMKEFSPSRDGDPDKSCLLTYRSKGNDEIMDLCDDVKSMQENILFTLQNLNTVTTEKEQIEAELSIATQIQAGMLPQKFPAFPERHEFDLFASMTPAKEVGGDFYDFFLVDDNHLCLVMADVSGKGVPAALFMAISKVLIKNAAMMGLSPSDILQNAHSQLWEENTSRLFVTVWLAILEISTGKGLAVNAGHEHPAVKRAGGRYELIKYSHSMPVASRKRLRFPEHEFQLYPGDSLFVYTDGVAEAMNPEKELFGTDRMLEALNSDPEVKPDALLPVVKNAIDGFVEGASQSDDITMLCLEYAG